jgi:hypothetical protein
MPDTDPVRDEIKFPPSTALMLVAVMPSPRDMEIARLFGWYRIPFRFAPKIVQVDHLAFYQPSSFGQGHANLIEAFAEVRGVELTKRREILRDEPDHPRADEEYYKIQIGDLSRLPEPIRAGQWKRITFLYTTGELFSRARLINDLVVKTEERKVLWHSLREKASSFEQYSQKEFPEMELDPETLMMLGDLNLIGDRKAWYQQI